MILPIALRIRAILPRVAWQRRAGDAVTPLASVTRVCLVRTTAEHISSVAQQRLCRAITSHASGVEQSIITNDNLDGLIWRQSAGEVRLAYLVWVIRPLIAVSDKVSYRHPFNDKSIRSSRLSSGDINRYV